MPRINLLPWREAAAQAQRQEFVFGDRRGARPAALVTLRRHVAMTAASPTRTSATRSRGPRSRRSTSRSRRSRGWRTEAAADRAHGDHRDSCSAAGPEIVHVFDEMVRVLPDGVYLKSLKQNGQAPRDRGRRPVEHARLGLHAQHRQLRVAGRPVAARSSRPRAGTRARREFTLFATQRSQVPVEAEGAAPRRWRPNEQLKASSSSCASSTRTIRAAGRCASALG